MPKRFAYILFLSLFLLASCNEEKNESSPLKSDEILLDVNTENYALNGKIIGNTREDIYRSEEFFIKSLDDELKKLKLQLGENNIKHMIRLSEDVYYSEFIKVLHTFRMNDFEPVRYTIGANASEVYSLEFSNDLIKKLFEDCWSLRQLHELYSLISNGGENYLNSSNKKDPQYMSSRLECIRNYMNLSILFPVIKTDYKYRVAFYETESIPLQVYGLKTEDELWNILKSVRENGNLQNKKDYDILTIWVHDLENPDVTMNQVEPLIKEATKLGYRLYFAYIE